MLQGPLSRIRRRAQLLATLLGMAPLALLALLALPAHADPQSKSHSRWHIDTTQPDGVSVQMVYTIAAREATRLGGNRGVASSNTRQLAESLQQHLHDTVSLTNSHGDSCEAGISRPLPSGEGYLRIQLAFLCSSAAKQLVLRIDSLFELAGSHIHFARITIDGEQEQERLFTGRQREQLLALGESFSQSVSVSATITAYTLFGFEHILIGLDHIAFLLTLMLLARGARDILLLVTGFTVGHSITLSLATLGVVNPNAPLVEALIGFTIALVAIENVTGGNGSQRAASLWLALSLALLAMLAAIGNIGPSVLSLLGLALFSFCYLRLADSEARVRRWRPAISALFGLVHGFGFAGVLSEVGLPEQQILPALLGFNIGVELGQLAIVAVLGLLGLGIFHSLQNWRQGVSNALSAGLCGLGVFWFIQRSFI